MFKKIILLTFISVAGQSFAQAQDQDPYAFSGPGCATHGDWTRAALDETKNIAGIMNGLLNDKNCKGLSATVAELNVASQTMQMTAAVNTPAETKEHEQSVDDLKSMSNVILGPDGQPNASIAHTFFTSLLNAASKSSYLPTFATNRIANPQAALSTIASLYKTSAHTSEQGMNALTAIMKVLPQYDQCLIGHPNESVLMLAGIVKMTSALSSSGSGNRNAIGNALAGLASMMRDRRFTAALRQTKRVEFTNSVSCLIETVSKHWCEIDNAQEIMQYFQQQRNTEVKERANQLTVLSEARKKRSPMGRATGNELPLIRSNPLNGFYLLSRELPIIAEWLQRVQIGAKPGLHTDAQFQNEVLQKVTDFQKLAKTVQGQFNEDMKILSTLNDRSRKQNHLYTSLVKVIQTLGGGGFEGGDAGFISNTKNNSELPFYLIGLDAIPSACTSAAGMNKVTWDEWMQKNAAFNNGYIPQFNEPEVLAQTIQKRMEDLLLGANDNSSVYYRNFLIADRVNLVNETSTGPMLTVKGAFQNLYLYLSSLEKDFRDSGSSPTTLASIIEFKQGIRRFNEAFKNYETIAIDLDAEMIKIVKMRTQAERKAALLDYKIAERVQDAADKVIDSAFKEFNIRQSRDGYVTNKMRTFIQMDLKNRLEASRAVEKMSTNTHMILNQSQRDLLNYALKVVTDDPTLAQLDLAQAKAIETSNLYTLGRVFKDTLYYMILERKSYVKKWTGEQFSDAIKAKLGENSTSVLGTVLPFMAWTGGEAKHPDLYAELSHIYHGKRIDDRFHSSERTLALYCSLSLSLPTRSYFMDVCKGSVLKSYFEENRKTLDLRYNDFLATSDAAALTASDPVRNSKAICALNRHLIYNKVAYLRDQETRSGTTQSKTIKDRADRTEDLFDEADRQAVGTH